MIKRAKIERTLLLFLCGLLSAGSFAIHGLMAGYNPVLKISNQRYDAQIVKPSKTSGYPIYYSGPYFTSSSSRTADSNSSNYSNDYVRVMQTKTPKTGTYAKLRLFNQTIGWMNIKGLKKATLTQVANATMKQNDVSGSALLASAGSKHTVIVNNGFANRTKKLANTSNGSVVYPLASLQKSMTAAMIQQLISRGQLTPTTKLSNFYPQIKGSSNITIKQMLSMTSGLDNVDIDPSKAMTESQAYASMVKRANATGKTTFDYSDANYVLLAGIIAKITKQSYAQNLQTRILNKVKMTHTFIVDNGKAPSTPIALSYTRNGQTDYSSYQTASLPRLSAIPGAGNLLTTPSDYYQFILGLQNGAILTAQQYQQLLSYGSVYSGGLYVTQKGVKYNNGSFGGQNYHSGYFATTGNYHLAIVFENQDPSNMTPKAFVKKMYQVATYY